jgi:hypothetical protein
MQKILTLGTIRDYILEYFPQTMWWDGFQKHQLWNKELSFKHRAGLPNEIRIEFDSDDKDKNWLNCNLTSINLYSEGYSFAIFYVEGGRSPHIHIYDLDELEQLPIEKRNKYRELFLNKICPKDSNPDYGLCDEKHLCALEFANHFKYGKPKQLLSTFGKSQRGLDLDLKLKVWHEKEKKVIVKTKEMKLTDLLRGKTREIIIQHLTFQQVFEKYKIENKGKMALCPFHADKDLSLSFSNEKGLWKCWGCGEKGDIITLIKMLKERENGNKS